MFAFFAPSFRDTSNMIDFFNEICSDLITIMIQAYDSINVEPSSKEEVLDNSDGSLYDVFGHDKNTDEDNPAFDDEVVITFFPKEMEFPKIRHEQLDFSMKNHMTNNLVISPKMDNNVPKDNTLSDELSFFEMITKVFLAIGMTFEVISLLSDSYTFSMETSHWRLIVQLSRHKQPQWLFIVKNQWFLTNSQVEEFTLPMFELHRFVSNMFDPPRVVYEHDRDSKSHKLLSDEITKFVEVEQPSKNVLTDFQVSNVFIGLWMLMKLFVCLFHSQKCELFWAAREILSQELLSGQLTGFSQSLRGLFIQILSSHLLSGQLCYLKKVRGLFHQILSSDLLSGQLCYLKKTRRPWCCHTPDDLGVVTLKQVIFD